MARERNTSTIIEKIDKPKPIRKKKRYFIVDFVIQWSVNGNRGIITDSVKAGPVDTYPNKNAIVEQLPTVYGVTAIEGVSDIQVSNIRPWELTKADFEEFTA